MRYGPNGENAPSTGNWIKAQRVDLAAWQAFYRGSNNVFSAKGGPPTNYFPIAKAAPDARGRCVAGLEQVRARTASF